MIYTSGSTGRPKGVQVTHANVARLLSATQALVRLRRGRRLDAVPLLRLRLLGLGDVGRAAPRRPAGRGARTRSAARPRPSASCWSDEGVTVLNQTPSAFRQLVRAEADDPLAPGALALRCVIFGGEALEAASLRALVRAPRRRRVRGWSTCTASPRRRCTSPTGRSRAGDLAAAGSAIGVPIPDLRLYLLDPRLSRCPSACPARSTSAARGVARGYLSRPELTAERFVPDPFGEPPGRRLYRSGDLARRRPDGDLEYLGRARRPGQDPRLPDRAGRDRGGAAAHIPSVREAVVLARADGPATSGWWPTSCRPRIAAPALDELRALPARAPAGATWCRRPSCSWRRCPLTANGKIDRRALPGAGRDAAASSDRAMSPPRTAVRGGARRDLGRGPAASTGWASTTTSSTSAATRCSRTQVIARCARRSASRSTLRAAVRAPHRGRARARRRHGRCRHRGAGPARRGAGTADQRLPGRCRPPACRSPSPSSGSGSSISWCPEAPSTTCRPAAAADRARSTSPPSPPRLSRDRAAPRGAADDVPLAVDGAPRAGRRAAVPAAAARRRPDGPAGRRRGGARPGGSPPRRRGGLSTWRAARCCGAPCCGSTARSTLSC